MNENKPRTLAQKLLELQKTVIKLGKNQKGYDYKFVSGSKLLSFIRPAMDELGLLLVPDTEGVEQQIVKTLEAIPASGSYKGRPEKYEVLVTLKKTFTWVDTETGEKLKTTFISQGCNGWDKAIGSAETYAERYFLLKFFHIATDEDDVDLVNATRATEDDKENNAAELQRTAVAAAPKKKPTAEEIFAKWVEFVAYGKTTKEGVPGREAYIQKFHPTEEQLMAFDKAVLSYQLNNNIGA